MSERKTVEIRRVLRLFRLVIFEHCFFVSGFAFLSLPRTPFLSPSLPLSLARLGGGNGGEWGVGGVCFRRRRLKLCEREHTRSHRSRCLNFYVRLYVCMSGCDCAVSGSSRRRRRHRRSSSIRAPPTFFSVCKNFISRRVRESVRVRAWVCLCA